MPFLPPDERVCFWGGWGGSMVLMNPDRRTTATYVMNKMGQGTLGNERTARYATADLRGAFLTVACWRCGTSAQSVGHFWWLIFPLGGMVGGGVRAVAAANERRAERRLERYRIKQQTKIAVAEAAGRSRTNEIKYRRELKKVIEQHGQTDARWLEYEIDVAKLLDFPLMTDMRNPLTMEFHKARRRADLLRPENADDLDGDREAQLEYRDAVHDYVTAFDVAEAEAIRLRRSTFSDEDQQRIARAQNLLKLAEDEGATPQERQNAYARAQRRARQASWRCPPSPGPASSASSPERLEA